MGNVKLLLLFDNNSTVELGCIEDIVATVSPYNKAAAIDAEFLGHEFVNIIGALLGKLLVTSCGTGLAVGISTEGESNVFAAGNEILGNILHVLLLGYGKSALANLEVSDDGLLEEIAIIGCLALSNCEFFLNLCYFPLSLILLGSSSGLNGSSVCLSLRCSSLSGGYSSSIGSDGRRLAGPVGTLELINAAESNSGEADERNPA